MMDILDEVKKDFVNDLISKGKRPDERAFDQYRNITVEKGAVPSAEGSARVHLGQTQVLVGVKIGLGTPFPDRPDEGVLSTNAELLPLASPTFEPGPPSPESIELARVVDRGIRSSNAIDLKSLFIEEDKVRTIFVDIYVLDHDGNMFDAASLASMAAIENCRIPKVEDGKIVFGEYSGKLKVSNRCVTTTFAKIGNVLLVDPSLDEEKTMDSRMTIATTPEYVCAVQKGGPGGFTKDELLGLIDMSFTKGNELRALI